MLKFLDKPYKKIILIIILLIFPIYTFYYCFSDNINSIYATLSLKPISISKSDLNDDNVYLGIKRQIQKHYLNYNKYVPIENIFFTNKTSPLYPAIQKNCGDSLLYVYIPLKFRIPIIGFINKNKCFKLDLKIIN